MAKGGIIEEVETSQALQNATKNQFSHPTPYICMSGFVIGRLRALKWQTRIKEKGKSRKARPF